MNRLFDVLFLEDPEASVHSGRSHGSFAPLPVHEDRSVMEQNIITYHNMHDELVAQYLGDYVAICDGKMVDHDADPVLLLERIRRDYPEQVVLRRKVEKLPECELHIRHPLFEHVP